MEQTAFIGLVGPLARADMQKNGVLASLTIAQAILESGWGTSELAQNANALFGIKADDRWGGRAYSKDTKECYDGVNYTTVTALFRAYDSWEESVSDHSAFLLTGSRYAAVIGEKDYKTACKAIKAAGYATAPDYAEKLISLIERYGLTAYDGAETEKEESIMSNSPLVTYTKISPHRNAPRNHVIDTITIHCIVGQWTAKQGCDYFAATDRECSANYVVGKDGSIGLSVEEKDRSWCSSNAQNDHRAITIEVASDTTHPYAVTAEAYAALLDLVTDICQRNGIEKLIWSTNKTDRVNHANGCNMTVHRDYAAKACPGDYLYERHGAIAEEVNKRLGVSSSTTADSTSSTASNFPDTPFTVKVLISDLNYRKGPGMSYAVNGQTGKGIFTITEVKNGWGKLKSDAGWIYLENPDYCTIQGSAAATSEPGYITYTVVKGDSLWAIAAKLLGDGNRYKEIKVLSGLTSDTIYAGDVLKVPAK